jgi:hypothetical protein
VKRQLWLININIVKGDILLMKPGNEVTHVSLKTGLFSMAAIFAMAAALLIILSTSAAPETGDTPATAISLINDVNRGVLGPGEQHWFEFKPAPGQTIQVEKFLTLIFSPDDGQRIRQVTMQLFEPAQLPLFYQGDASKMTNFGAGQVISRDNHPQTGELFWTGWLFGHHTYYIQILNGSDISIDYWLFPDNVVNPALGEPDPPAAPALAEGTAPQTARSIKLGANKGELEPGQEAWYSFRMTDFDQQPEEHFQEMALTMITTPDNGIRIQNITFDVYTADQVQPWSPDDHAQLYNVGAGSVVLRDDNPLTGERFWSGWVINNGLYYVQVRNGTDAHMDYWLFPGDVYRPELGEEPVAADPESAPSSAVSGQVGLIGPPLNLKEVSWYRLRRAYGEHFGPGVETTFTK